MTLEYLIVALGGAAGALVKLIIADNFLVLPKKIDGKLSLGFLGSLLIGAFVGYMIDGSFVTAAMAGFTGFSVIENLVPGKAKTAEADKATVEKIIRLITAEESVDADLAVRVAECESGLDPKATHTNADGSIDRGLFQINTKWHPEAGDEIAFSIESSTRFFCKAFKAGNLSWWDNSKACWGLDKKTGYYRV
jgi:hypothetical protein